MVTGTRSVRSGRKGSGEPVTTTVTLSVNAGVGEGKDSVAQHKAGPYLHWGVTDVGVQTASPVVPNPLLFEILWASTISPHNGL